LIGNKKPTFLFSQQGEMPAYSATRLFLTRGRLFASSTAVVYEGFRVDYNMELKRLSRGFSLGLPGIFQTSGDADNA
jgi:hypothetical protein